MTEEQKLLAVIIAGNYIYFVDKDKIIARQTITDAINTTQTAISVTEE